MIIAVIILVVVAFLAFVGFALSNRVIKPRQIPYEDLPHRSREWQNGSS